MKQNNVNEFWNFEISKNRICMGIEGNFCNNSNCFFFWKVTILLSYNYRSIPTQKRSKLSKDKLSYNAKYEERL